MPRDPERLFADYAWALDEREPALLAAVFTDDAELTITVPGGLGLGPLRGLATIQEVFGARAAGRADRRRHVITNVRAGAEHATALLTLLAVTDGAASVLSCGVYQVRLACEGDAVRFAAMHLTLDAPL
jgi:hypothetical protein